MARPRADFSTPSLLDPLVARVAPVARVALLRPIDKPLSYIIPDELQGVIHAGMRVSVPFGRNDKPTPGVCISVSDESWLSTLKPVLGAIDDFPLLGPALLELGEWMASYYASHLGRTLDLMVPAAAKRQAGTRSVRYVTLAASARSDAPREAQVPSDPAAPSDAHAPNSVGKLPPKQSAVLDLLRTVSSALPLKALAQRAGCTPAVIRSLEKRGLIRIESRREFEGAEQETHRKPDPDFELNADQLRAIDEIGAAIDARAFSVQVLFGVTGSGKTEVYIAAMRRALAQGRSAIMLVPEIALTTQTVSRLQERFDRVAAIHSGLSDVERSRTWAAVARGEIPVVIGTRSAVFAPCPNLGVIIVDEEAEPSYKNQASPRFHTRDVAVKRGHIEGVPVVLGSATPSLETWLNLKIRKHYRLVRLPNRVRGLAMPKMRLVDMAEEHRARPGMHLLSRDMEAALRETLERGEQAVVLLNRRGYASYLFCPKCRTTMVCPHCSVRLVFHQNTKMAHCHYCGRTLQVPSRCQTLSCGGTMAKFGLGTQRVEEQISKLFPNARVRRVDSDVMQSAADYSEVLGAFERREFDVLVGTQIVAKGLDFPFVSFVGIISADTALALDDFRSEERTFQLVLQVAGRSGRAETGGSVVVQTFAADTAPIQHAVKGDYEGFADAELKRRRELDLPPFTRMLRVILADGHVTKLHAAAEKMAADIRLLLDRHRIPVTIMDPRRAAIERLRDQYRYDVLLVFPTAAALVSAIAVLKDEGTFRARVKTVTIDVDPIALQ